MDIPDIIDEMDRLPKGALLRRAASTEPSSKKAFEEAFYVKLGPMPAFPRG